MDCINMSETLRPVTFYLLSHCSWAKKKFSFIALTHSLHLICIVLHFTVLPAKLFIQLYICKIFSFICMCLWVYFVIKYFPVWDFYLWLLSLPLDCHHDRRVVIKASSWAYCGPEAYRKGSVFVAASTLVQTQAKGAFWCLHSYILFQRTPSQTHQHIPQHLL